MPLFSHYGDVPDVSYRISCPALVFSIVTPIFVIVRFISRRVLTRRIGPDDWMILASVITAESLSVIWIVVCIWGFGKHAQDVPEHIMAKTLKLYFIGQVLYKLNIGLTKISILLLYIKIFLYDWFIITCWACIGLVVAFTIGTVVSSIVQCIPVDNSFDVDGARGDCIDMTAFWYANAGFNISSDIVIIILPVLVISRLMLPKKTKIAVCGVFALGSFVCVASILRIKTLDIATSNLDTTWNAIPCIMWTIIETNLGIICACLPTFRQSLSAAFPRISGWFYSIDSRTDNTPTGNQRKGREDFGLDTIDSHPSRWIAELRSMELEDLNQFIRPRNDSSEHTISEVDGVPTKYGVKKTTQVVVPYGCESARPSRTRVRDTTWHSVCEEATEHRHG